MYNLAPVHGSHESLIHVQPKPLGTIVRVVRCMTSFRGVYDGAVDYFVTDNFVIFVVWVLIIMKHSQQKQKILLRNRLA